ncbi:MAG TPA: NUDIX hydrolase [Chloroflexota bacterium]|nr:NUDIX hydrolase [Chloroflexota bacterium]
MIVLQAGRTKFTHRVAAVAVRDGHVLLSQCDGDGFWYLPGGRIDLLETASEALVREMREEMGVEVRVERLLWVIENYFGFDGFRNHELGLYFLTRLPDSLGPLISPMFDGREGHRRIIFRWFDLGSLEGEQVYPTFLKSALRNPPAWTEHIVHRDGTVAGSDGVA